MRRTRHQWLSRLFSLVAPRRARAARLSSPRARPRRWRFAGHGLLHGDDYVYRPDRSAPFEVVCHTKGEARAALKREFGLATTAGFVPPLRVVEVT